jgi:hypothetical protein
MRVLEGIVRDRVVVLPDGVQLEEGLQVEVHIRDAGQDSRESLFRQRLREAGLLEGTQEPLLQLPDKNRRPIQVKGKPLSEQVIEDRR